MGTGKFAGRRGMTTLSACGPPVEVPISTISTRPLVATPGGIGGSALATGRPWRSGACAAALTFSTSSSAMSSSLSVASAVGFCTKSMAPASRAASTASPAWLATLMMMIGTGRRAICARTKSVPSICGMFRSQVTTSGFSSATCSSASTPSRAVPTTSMNGLRSSICLTTLRT